MVAFWSRARANFRDVADAFVAQCHVVRRINSEAVGRVSFTPVVTLLCSSLVACAHAPNGNPAAPIDVKDLGIGYQYSQNGEPLERKQLMQVLAEGGAGLESEVSTQGRLYPLTQAMAIAGGALIGIPLGLWSADAGDPMWFLAGVGAGTLSVTFPIAIRADQRLHGAVLRHNAHHGVGSVASIPLLPAPRSGLLLRTGYSGAYVSVAESLEGVGTEGDLSFTGPGAGYDWSVGYSLISGLALTGSVLAVTQISPDVKAAGAKVDNEEMLLLHLTSLLGGLNYYPLADYGFYLQALAGYGAESASRGEQKVQTDAAGLVLAGTLGWDWSLGYPGAMGGFVRGLYAPLGGETPDNDSSGGTGNSVPFTNRWTGLAVGLSVTYY